MKRDVLRRALRKILTKYRQSIIDNPGVDFQDFAGEDILTLLKARSWKSPEEFFDGVMKAKKSGWDDCMKFYEGRVEQAKAEARREVIEEIEKIASKMDFPTKVFIETDWWQALKEEK